MARRKNINLKSKTEFQRREGIREPLRIFLIACEGESTEPKYLYNLLNTKRKDKTIAFGSDIIIARHGHSDPCGVLQDLLCDSRYDKSYERWIVIDRDPVENFGKGAGGHTEENFRKAIDSATEKGINVACSNPCFELWFILHFNYRNTAGTRKDIQKQSLKLFQENKILSVKDGIESMKSCEGLYEKLESRLNIAINNSDKLIKLNGKLFENPCTFVGELIKELEK